MLIVFLFFFVLFSFVAIYFCRKKNLLIDYKLEKHKRYSSKSKSYSLGGILLIIFLLYYYTIIVKEYFLIIFLLSIFLVGFLSDLKKINSVSLRFFLQLILILIFVQILNLEIKTTKIEFIDRLLSNNFFNIAFVSFCLMILINGGNFIDGLNGLILKYYTLVFLIIIYNFSDYFSVDTKFLINLIVILSIILVLNLYGFIYMGDSGAYLLSLLTGIYLINFSSNNLTISPYLMIVLLWYPCFELLFSMIRRNIKAIKTYKPDTYHLHQLIHDFFKSRYNFKNELTSHLFTSFVINLYNFLGFIISINFIYSSEILISILITNIFVYLIVYKLLSKKKIKINA